MEEETKAIEFLLPAMIGVFSAVLTILLRDVLLPWVNALKSQRQKESDLFEEYLHPILLGLEALLWRLNEALRQPGRGAYLHSSAGNSQYVEYKKISTIYRLCVVIGLFRAFERELLNVRLTDLQGSDHLRDAMKDFQATLADGKSIEFQKLDRLADLWAFGKVPEGNRDLAAVRIENEVDKRLGGEKHKGVRSLAGNEQKELLGEIYSIINAGFQPFDETRQRDIEQDDRAVEILSMRQTWIYRDWQAAIGDAMLVADPSGPRKYRVMGFGKFEDLWRGDRPIWLARVGELFLDFDVSGSDETDSRRMQLEKLLRTSAELVSRLLRDDKRLRRAMSGTWELTEKIALKRDCA
ncbi:MAG: hypothetical protein OEM24_06185 [Paracoccaceae bacterium]|nr:hypothetical protein [Paracoccaceae bacterium]